MSTLDAAEAVAVANRTTAAGGPSRLMMAADGVANEHIAVAVSDGAGMAGPVRRRGLGQVGGRPTEGATGAKRRIVTTRAEPNLPPSPPRTLDQAMLPQ